MQVGCFREVTVRWTAHCVNSVWQGLDDVTAMRRTCLQTDDINDLGMSVQREPIGLRSRKRSVLTSFFDLHAHACI